MWTMLEGFRHLTPAEIDALVDAPVLITILVGAADGELDREERYWADRLTQARTYARPKDLNDYYRVVSQGFLDKVDQKMATLPTDTGQRNEQIKVTLEELNPILDSLEIHLAADLYKSYVGLAEETAAASGGFLRIGAISAEEARWVDLPMLTPIIAPKQDETENSELES